MAVGDRDASGKPAPGPTVHFVDTQRPEELRRALETISHVRARAAAGRRQGVPSAGSSQGLARRTSPTLLLLRPPLTAPWLQALLTDGVSLYLSRPGSEHPFHHAVFASYLASGPQLVLQCADYGCVPLPGWQAAHVRCPRAGGLRPRCSLPQAPSGIVPPCAWPPWPCTSAAGVAP